MSRIGKQILSIPKDVKINIENGNLSVVGPKGKLERVIPNCLVVKKDLDILQILAADDSRETSAIHGLIRSLVANMITGVSKGFTKVLELRGIGYKGVVDKGILVLSLGYSHPVQIVPPTGITIVVESNTFIKVQGIDKESVGLVCQKIRKLRPPEPYKGKGIIYEGEVVQRKVGKSSK